MSRPPFCPTKTAQVATSKNGVATPISTGQVATLNRCRDQPLLLPQKRPCRDPKPWSRHQTTTRQPEPCRDIKSMSRHHCQCLLLRRQNRSSAQPGRDFHLWSRPHTLPSQVATSISSRDLKPTRPGRDLKVMSRPQIVFPMSQHEFHVTTQDPSVLTSTRSRHQKGCRDTNSSSLGRDAKTMLRPRPVWPRLRARYPGRGRALALSCALLRAQPPLPCAPAAFLSRPQH